MANTEAPKILGVAMTGVEAGWWVLRFGLVTATIREPERHLWGTHFFRWSLGSGCRYEETREKCIVAIERELLAIRAAIPEGGKP